MTRIHKHLYSQGQLTIVHLFWTDVLSGSTAQVSVLSFTRRRPHFIIPQVVLSSSAGPRASFQSMVGSHYLFSLTILCRAPLPWTYGKRPLPCGSSPPPAPKCSETVMMVMMVVMMTATPLFMVSTHCLSGLHCSATFIKKSVS